MSNLFMTVLCVAAGSGLRSYQLLALLHWIMQQKPPIAPGSAVNQRRSLIKQA